MNEPIFLHPELKTLIWGSELWCISAHKKGDCLVKSGKYAGEKLSTLWKTKPEIFGVDKKYSNKVDFPLLVKIITSNDDLSVQVHPDNEYAAEHEGESVGKSECWYILDCDEDARIIIGHNCNDREEFKEKINAGLWDEILVEKPIRPGDFMQINPGTIHAIKAGTKLIEVQQTSDITYRVYDYDRLQNGKPRDLHIEDAINVTDYKSGVPEIVHFDCDKNLKVDENSIAQLIETQYYIVEKAIIQKEQKFENNTSFICATVIKGVGEIGYINQDNSLIEWKKIEQEDAFIIPARCDKYWIKGNVEIIFSRINQQTAQQDQ